jgi:DNA-binding response OmpR family regulator
MRILLAEDDMLLGDGLRAGLRQRGYQVDWVRDGAAAERELRAEPYAAAVLDLGLPLLDGMQVLASVRRAGIKLPVLVLTARDTVPDRVRGLDVRGRRLRGQAGGPGRTGGAAARAGAPRARPGAGTAGGAGCVLDPAGRSVTQAGAPVVLSTREFDLLHVLMLGAGRVLSREQIEQQLYSWGQEVESNAVEVHVHHLRRKLGASLIQTVRGVGYMVARESRP